MNAERPLPQPSFGLISESFGALSEQFALCANLPAVDGGAGLMRSLETITNQLVLLNQRMETMDRRIQGLDTKVTAEYVLFLWTVVHGMLTIVSDRSRNAVARGQNATATGPTSELVALCSPRTAATIDPFPPTLGDLERLDGESLRYAPLCRVDWVADRRFFERQHGT